MTKFQNIWAHIAVALVILATLVSQATPVVAALSVVGILFVLGVAYKDPRSQLLGAVFVGILGYLSFGAAFYANAVVNLFFLVPLSIWGYWHWRKRRSEGVIERSLGLEKTIVVYVFTMLISGLVFFTTGDIGSALPFLDSLTAVLPVVATVLMVFAYKEQWLFWIPFNIIQAYMWFFAAALNPAVLAVFVLKLVFLLNSLIGYYYWRKKT